MALDLVRRASRADLAQIDLSHNPTGLPFLRPPPPAPPPLSCVTVCDEIQGH